MTCLNWKVVAALAAVGVALWLAVPGAAAALPLLVLLACPLSMLVMMRAMRSAGSSRIDGTSCRREPRPEVSDIADLRAQVAALRAERNAVRSTTEHAGGDR